MMEDDKVKDKVSEQENENIISKCEERVIYWIGKNQTAEQEKCRKIFIWFVAILE